MRLTGITPILTRASGLRLRRSGYDYKENSDYIDPEEFFSSLVDIKACAAGVDEKLNGLGLRLETWAILNQLSVAPQIQRQLAESTWTSKVAISRFVTELCAAGYVFRIPGNSDRRINQIEITDDGTEILNRATEIIRYELKLWSRNDIC